MKMYNTHGGGTVFGVGSDDTSYGYTVEANQSSEITLIHKIDKETISDLKDVISFIHQQPQQPSKTELKSMIQEVIREELRELLLTDVWHSIRDKCKNGEEFTEMEKQVAMYNKLV